MSVLLVAINSKYSHTNLAVRSIAGYVKENLPEVNIKFDEWTIQEPILNILRGIKEHKPRVVIFSVYIWNCQVCYSVAEELKKEHPRFGEKRFKNTLKESKIPDSSSTAMIL